MGLSEISVKNQSSSLPILGIVLALGLIAAAFVLGVQFKNFRQPGTITVKGLAEKNFQSDSAVWTTGVSLHEETYQSALEALDAEQKKLVAFLKNQGFETQEIKIGLPNVEQAYTGIKNEKGETIEQKPNGYDGTLSVSVNTKKLDKVQAAQSAILKLRAGNDRITFSSPEYLLGNLEVIKRNLITQATEDAQKRADEFAKTGGGKVGSMRSASQGSFNIYAEAGNGDEEGYGGSYDKTTMASR